MISIDNAGEIAAKDPDGMLGAIQSFPAQLNGARKLQTQLQTRYPKLKQQMLDRGIREVVVCGMGGSAIGGEFAAAWAASEGLRVSVHRDYGLPGWIDERHLVVFSSYSGNTEETLSAYEDSLQKAGARICVTTGGSLEGFAKDENVPVLTITPGLQPRAALGHSLVAQLVVLHGTGLVMRDPVPELEGCARFLTGIAKKLGPEVPESSNPAKQLARLFHGILPFFITGNGLAAPVGKRWRGQLNENAKALAVSSTLPEMNHNEIMGWTALPNLRSSVRIFLLRDREDSACVKKRMAVTAELLGPAVMSVEWLDTRGETTLERMLSASLLGDFASLYLAFLNDVDPTPVAKIDELKRRLAQS